MNRKISAIVFLLFFVILLGCAGCGQKRTTQTAETMDTAGLTKNKNHALSIQGRQLAAAKCTGCHQFYRPEAYTKKQWESTLQWKSRRLSLDPDEMAALSSYFIGTEPDRK